jgi:ABC-type glycerol-3-phosphate transport system permease component
MFFYLPFATYTLNSLIVAFSTMILTLAIGSLAAFAFARFQFKGRGLILIVFLLSQMLPGASIIIPLFQLMQQVGLYDMRLGLVVVHTALLLPFVIWLLYGFFQTIPREVEDAALIDGCSRLQALRMVILPLAPCCSPRPTLPGPFPSASGFSWGSIWKSGTRWRRRPCCSACRPCCCSSSRGKPS